MAKQTKKKAAKRVERVQPIRFPKYLEIAIERDMKVSKWSFHATVVNRLKEVYGIL